MMGVRVTPSKLTSSFYERKLYCPLLAFKLQLLIYTSLSTVFFVCVCVVVVILFLFMESIDDENNLEL